MKHTTRRILALISILILASITIPLALGLASKTTASPKVKVEVLHEYAKLTIEKNGTVILEYWIRMKVNEGAIRRYIQVGMPIPSFKVVKVIDKTTNKTLRFKPIRESPEKCFVEVYPNKPVREGEEIEIYLKVFVYDFLFPDEVNPGNIGMLFKPASWIPEAITGVRELRILIILPPGVSIGEFKCIPDYDNILTVNGRIALYWERHNRPPQIDFDVGVSFPEKYVVIKLPPETIKKPKVKPTTRHKGISPGTIIAIIILAIFFVFSAIGAVVSRKEEYESPLLVIEALGPRKGLTAVEAAYLIMKYEGRREYEKILTMILYGMLKKGFAIVTSYNPLRIHVFKEKIPQMRYYEREFAECLKPNGEIDETKIHMVFDKLDNVLREKMRGYCLKDTIKYYKDIVKRAWDEVKKAKTPEVKLRKVNENLEWLMLDPDFEDKMRSLPDIIIIYDPTWDWYWTRIPAPAPPPRPGESISLRDIADRIASSVENTARDIASKVEKAADKIAEIFDRDNPSRTSPSERFTGGSCICVCVSCACVCACVSCACACASGGVG